MDTPAAHILGQAQLDQAVAVLNSPSEGAAGHINAVMGAVDKTGVQVVTSWGRATPTASWQLQAIAHHDWKGDNDAEVKVILKW